MGRVIVEINPILQGWAEYFRIRNAARCFAYARTWVEKKVRRHLMRARKRPGFGWTRWSTGGAPGPVDVTFGVIVDAFQNLLTDPCGMLADSEVIFSLELFGPDVTTGPLLFFQSHLTIGSDSSDGSSFNGDLTATAPLTVDTPYAIFKEADAESSGINTVPEPGTLLLVGLSMLGSLGAVLARHRPDRGDHRSPEATSRSSTS